MGQEDYITPEVHEVDPFDAPSLRKNMGKSGGNPDLPFVSRATHHDGPNSKLPDAFHNDHEPVLLLKKETAKHRLCVFMAASGANHQEIAEAVGLQAAAVSNILRQPWARARIQAEIKHAGQDELRNLLSSAALPALERLIHLSESATKEDVKLRANNSILDRFLGKSVQPYADETKPSTELTDEELHARIARHNAPGPN